MRNGAFVWGPRCRRRTGACGRDSHWRCPTGAAGTLHVGRLRPIHTVRTPFVVATGVPAVDGRKGVTGLSNPVRSARRLRADLVGRCLSLSADAPWLRRETQ